MMAFAGSICLASVASSAAANRPLEQASCSVHPAPAPAASNVHLVCAGFTPSAPVTVNRTANSSEQTPGSVEQTGNLASDNQGRIELDVFLPGPGPYTLKATSGGHAVTAEASVTAVEGAGAQASGPAATFTGLVGRAGGNSGVLVWSLAGSSALLAGASAVVTTRRRYRKGQ